MVRGFSRCFQVALIFLAPGVALLAQHGGPAHAGGVVHTGPSPSFSGAPRSFAAPPMAHSPSSQVNRPGHWPSSTADHRGDNGRGEKRYRGPYLYAGYPWLSSFGYGLPYGNDLDDEGGPQPAPQPADQPMIDYGPQVAANAPPPFRPAYQAPVETAPVHAQPATTLIFKDGRPPTQVHNYALTGSTLYALDGESRREIPLSLLNVPATVEANRDAGVDFALPVSR